jgi:DNA polymerase III subunit epsilon
LTVPVFEDAADKILNMLDGVLVGHSVDFDYRFLKRSFRALRVKYKRECLDIVKIERWLRQKRKIVDMDLSFDAMMNFYGLKQYYRHNAIADAFFAAQIFQMQMQEMDVLGVDTTDKVIKAVKNCRDTSCDLGFEYGF